MVRYMFATQYKCPFLLWHFMTYHFVFSARP